ncbi:MAG: ATP-binding protein, partial [Candidatus Aminicenantes bacterium]|nr:ATP-binding protein [Candidatus Aminicenantes bacterium]
APKGPLASDADALRDRVLSAVSGLLTLIGLDADPIQSREHILLSNILHNAWSQGKNLDIARLIQEIQEPPFSKVGVFNLDSFYPAKERFSLAMSLNNLLASPGFAAWMEGEALDIGRLLYTADGRPRLSILSIAHLSEKERMFFVTLLLNEVVAWMRTQPGTSSLRAILYMDEIFGYFPPTAMPPSKTPMLTLLKQARAFGLGVVLATQNPVDLDYKGLSNTGTWFIGRLQTERDMDRVLDGLEGASVSTGAGFKRKDMEQIISGLGKRVFLLHNVHEDQPVLFQTRWALSYLRGPLTRMQIQTLMDERKSEKKETGESQTPQAPAIKTDSLSHDDKPILPPGISQYFIPTLAAPSDEARLLYRPNLFVNSKLHFVHTQMEIDLWREQAFIADIPEDELTPPWDQASSVSRDQIDLEKDGLSMARYAPLPATAQKKENYSRWKKDLSGYLYSTQTLSLWKCPELKAFSNPEERKGDFIARLTQMAREARDTAVEKLRNKYGTKLAQLETRQRRAMDKMQLEKSQYSQQKLQSAVSVGASVLGALFGRKLTSRTNIGKAASSMRGLSRAAKEKQDITRAKEELRIVEEQLAQMEAEFQGELKELQDRFQPEALTIEETPLKSRKSDISVSDVLLVWSPWLIGPMGMAEPAFDMEKSET